MSDGWACPECGAIFESRDALAAHLDVTLGLIRPYPAIVLPSVTKG